MLSQANSRNNDEDSNSGTGKFINDLEIITKAMYMDKAQPRLASPTSSRSKSIEKPRSPEPRTKNNNTKDSSDKEKKPSIWTWKGLKALAQFRNQRFNCCFSLLVHSVEGLPAIFDDVCLVVHWKRRDSEQMTRPVRVYQGVAEIEEQLTHSCSVYGSRSGLHNSIKYDAKHFLLYASVYNAPELELGKNRVDMTRLLPLTLEELEDEKSSGKWTTSFRLSGKARGATMNVSFSYVVIGNNKSVYKSVPESPRLRQDSEKIVKLVGQFDLTDDSTIRRVESLPARLFMLDQSSEDIKDLHEVFPVSNPELSESVNVLYQKLDEEMFNAPVEKNLDADAFNSHVEPRKLDSFTPHDGGEIFNASVGKKSDGDTFNSHVESQKVDSFTSRDAGEKNSETEWEISEFSVIEKGIEDFTKEQVNNPEEELSEVARASEEVLETDGAVENTVSQKDEQSMSTSNSMEIEIDEFSKDSLMKELETALSYTTDLVNEGLDSQEDDTDALHQEDEIDAFHREDETDTLHQEDENSLGIVYSCYGDHRRAKSLSLDDLADSVANDFLDMLGLDRSPSCSSSESEPESPRERLLKQFEKDALANGGLLDFEIEDDLEEELVGEVSTGSIWKSISTDHGQSSMGEAFQEMPDRVLGIKTRASRLEDLESEALMRDWGLNEEAFQHSPPSNSGGFGSPVNITPNELHQLPPLADGLGPFVRTRNGGFLRSMSPALFLSAKNGGSLVMQVSSPVVVPAEMGSGVMDILQGLAVLGIEKLSKQANRLMPLEDMTGSTIQQIAWEAGPCLEGPKRHGLLHHESEIMQKVPREHKSVKGIPSGPRSGDLTSFATDAEYVSLEDLAPLAMDKIEALSLEGLRIQSGMSYEDAPSNITVQSIGEFAALKGKAVDVGGGSIGLDGTGGLQLLDIKDNGEDVDGLMGLSLTLDEWMRFDSGEVNDDDLASERTSKILAAHHANSLYAFRGRSKGEKKRCRGRKYGLLGNNFTVALMVQLRDPLRNYEPVGPPMLSLVQVERVFVPPKTKIYSGVPNIDEVEEEAETPKSVRVVEEPHEDKIREEDKIPQYKITEVHVAGLKVESGKKKLWGSTNQEKAGSRWLLANGMGKKNKHPLMKPKAVVKNSGYVSSPVTTKVQPGDTLWSISTRIHGTGNKWKDLAALNPHIRNPNVLLPNETIRLR